ncbi:MAG TPA: sulfite exporter TauE/SafE family protein [Patescibacteria group bacterium]|nr:sulfite exporter TauE/SafE family protein [Patescibacteria group bacterium]
MPKTIVPIRGMHCRSCEILIEDEILKLSWVKKVEVSHQKAQAKIYYRHKFDYSAVEKAISKAGYRLGNSNKKQFISKNPQDFIDLVIAAICLLGLFLFLKKTGLINIKFASSPSLTNISGALLIGILAGFSTCMALVGGLILGISARHSEKHPNASTWQKFRPHLFFNLGRIASFFILGGLIGFAGSALQLSSRISGTLMIGVGLLMLTLGIQLTEIFPKISSGRFTLPKGISQILGIKKREQLEYSHKNAVILGAATFFLPCGFTQAMQLLAVSSGKFLVGAEIMALFAIGTSPGLLGIGALTSVFKGTMAKKFFKFAGLAVISLALLNIVNGYHLLGWKFSSKKAPIANAQDPNVKIENGIQKIYMVQKSSGYAPDHFTIQRGISTQWIINSEDASSCASAITAPDLDIKKILKLGENIIEFTPQKTGEVGFSCLMGMYRGYFSIIEKKDSQDTQTQTQNQKPKTESEVTPPKTNPAPITNEQIIKTTYTLNEDIVPKQFMVQAGLPVRFEIDVKEDGQGCMSTIGIPKLIDEPQFLEKGKTIVFTFTPEEPGDYYITCAMGSIRGKISVK